MSPNYVVVIGAARSGTKMLRDALAAATGAGQVPYDIGYVWRAGNESCPDDVLDPAAMDVRTRRFIRGYLDGFVAGSPPAVVEKTVGNALRLPAVATVLPEASYVHLIRDGVDVIESAMRQWTAPPDLRYLAAKARSFPVRLVPRYGFKYARSLAGRRGRERGRVGSWGLRYPGIDADLRATDLLTVCARQWRSAVTLAQQDFERLRLPVIEIRYEQLVRDPSGQVSRVAEFTGLRTSPQRLKTATRRIVPQREGSARAELSTAQLQVVAVEVGHLLAELDYDVPLTRRNDARG